MSVAFFFELPNVIVTVWQRTRNVDPNLLDMARLYEHSELSAMRRVIFPAILPDIVTTLCVLIDGFMSERWRIEPEYVMKVDHSVGLFGVLLEPTTVVAKVWEQIAAVGQRAFWEPRTALVTGAGPGRGTSRGQEPGPPAKCVSDRTRRAPGLMPPPVFPCRGRSIRRAAQFRGMTVDVQRIRSVSADAC